MLLKFEIIWLRIDQVIRLQNDINFSETLGGENATKVPFFWLAVVSFCLTVLTISFSGNKEEWSNIFHIQTSQQATLQKD